MGRVWTRETHRKATLIDVSEDTYAAVVRDKKKEGATLTVRLPHQQEATREYFPGPHGFSEAKERGEELTA